MLTKNKIRGILIQGGVSEIIATKRLAEILCRHPRTIDEEKNRGHLKQIDRSTFDMDSIVDWLYARPRHLVRLIQKQSRQE